MFLRSLSVGLIMPIIIFCAENSWTIENGEISAKFKTTNQGQFYPVEIKDQKSGFVWHNVLNRPPSLLNLRVNDRILDGETAYKFVVRMEKKLPSGKDHVFIFDEKNRTGSLTLHVEIYDGQPFLRTYWLYHNFGPEKVVIKEGDILNWSFVPDENYRAFYVEQWRWEMANFGINNQDISWQGWPARLYTGAYGKHCSWVAVKRGIEDGPNFGLIAGWEFNGRAEGSVYHDKGSNRLDLRVRPVALHYPLESGQAYLSPASFLGLFNGDWDEAGYRTQRFVEQVIAKPMPDPEKFPYVIFDTWGYGEKINEKTMRKAAEIALNLGVEVFTVDLGWARSVGDWRYDPKKFPNGIRSLSDYVRDRGMKFGLHWPFIQAHAKSPVLKKNPDWQSSVDHGYFGAGSLCLGHKPVKNWVINEGLRLIRDYKIDWLLQDGENMVKFCTKSSHTHHPENSNYANSNEGLDEVIASIQNAAPSTIWENCEDGGAMMTYKMTRQYATSILSDNINNIDTLRAIWGGTFPFPPRYSVRYMQEHPTKYSMRVHMFGGPMILMQAITEWDFATRELVAKEIGIYKNLRTMIRDSKIIHLLDQPQPVYKKDAEGKDIAVSFKNDAIQAYHEETDASVIFVYRHQGPTSAQLINPRGLNPRTEYRVSFQESKSKTSFVSGRILMKRGIDVVLPTQEFAEIIYIEPAGKPPFLN